MEKYVSATISLKKNTSTNDLGTCATNCLDDCRSAHDDNPRKKPSAVATDGVPDADEMDEDFSENIGMEE